MTAAGVAAISAAEQVLRGEDDVGALDVKVAGEEIGRRRRRFGGGVRHGVSIERAIRQIAAVRGVVVRPGGPVRTSGQAIS